MSHVKHYWLLPAIAILSFACVDDDRQALPNIVYILADDLGYGDVSAFNPNSAWQTTAIDRIAREGMIFTDAHSGSAVCTPTRYGILTGRYSWRSRLQEGVLWSWDPPLIDSTELTVAGLLRRNGYRTACIGKWHLGLGWQYHEGFPDSVNFSLPVTGGPTSLGFDYFFGITASLDIPPYVYIENDRSTTIPVKYTEDLSDMGWWRQGLTGSDFEHREVLQVLTSRAVDFIDHQSRQEPDIPFFLYFPMTAPHTPILPAGDFQSASGTNPYGDFVLQVDHSVALVLDALDRNGIGNNTLLVFTSDNGCSPYADYEELAHFGHDPSYVFRGAKADIFEGGHRIPFVVRWPGKIPRGKRYDGATCLTDLLATAAAITGDTLGASEGVDSYNLLPVLTRKQSGEIREATVHHSVNGSFAIRRGKWKLILCPDSGGWSDPQPGSKEAVALPPVQLYNLESDLGEDNNLIAVYPDIAQELRDLLEYYRSGPRSAPTPVREH